MKNSSFVMAKAKKNWLRLVRKSRKKYECTKLLTGHAGRPSPRLILRSIYIDLLYVVNQLKKIRQEIANHGSIINAAYAVSNIRQFYQLCYLTFVLHISVRHYRNYLLFKPERWKKVHDFTYESYPVQIHLIDCSHPEEKKIFNNKLFFHRHGKAHNIPTPTLFSAFKDGKIIFCDDGGKDLPADDIFVKDVYGRLGMGTACYRYQNGAYIKQDGTIFQRNELKKTIRQTSHEQEMMVQPVIKNHSEWERFTPGALATCRILTARRIDGPIIPIAASLKTPTGNSITDNLHFGGMAYPINLDTGMLGKAISTVPRNGKFEFTVHPDTHQELTGTPIYGWQKVLNVTLRAHATFKTIFVGWDVALTTNGVSIIEGNIGWGVGILESPQNVPLTDTPFAHIFTQWMKKFG